MNELKLAIRRLLRAPGFSLTALLTMALCLGANLTLFAVVDSVLLRPLPFPAPEQLVTVFNSYPKAGLERDKASVYNYYSRRGAIAAFASLSALREGTAIVAHAGTTQREDVIRVSSEFFATLGVGPAMGRAFSEQETQPQADNAVVISDALWRERFDADPAVLGRTLAVDGLAREIVGVLPAGFRWLSSNAELFLPLAPGAEDRRINAMHAASIDLIGRLAPGANVAQAQAQVEAHIPAESQGFPWAREVEAAGFYVTVAPLHADHVAAIRGTLLLLQAGVLCLLLIGGVNLVNLLLIRASARTRELSIRQALGAGRRHVLRQVATETVLLSLAGGVLGLAVGAAGIRVLAWMGADRMPLVAHVVADGRLAIAALAGAVGLGIAVALPIAWFHLRGQVANALQSESRGGTSGHAAQRLRHAFIVAQIALAFVLLAGAGLLGVSLRQAMSVPPGFRPDHVMTGQVSLPDKDYPDGASRLAFADRLLDGISHRPGVVAAGVSTNMPVKGRNADNSDNVMTIDGYEPEPGVSPALHYRYAVSGDYFGAMAIPLRQGRYLETADSHSGLRNCVVDEDFARRYWPDGNALGKRIFEGPDRRPDDQAFTVVGVVGAVRQSELTDTHDNGAIYFPFKYFTDSDVYVVTRTSQAPESIAPVLRATVREIDPALPIDQLRAMDARIADTLVSRRSPALLAGVFAAVALLLAAIGTYGVLSYAVSQRRREVGMRMALGAQPRQIRAHFLALGLRLLAAGGILGLIGAWIAGQAMQSLLFGVSGVHAPTLAVTATILGAVALLACLLPAYRAARISPMEVLGDE